jgi:3-hydroxy acid dehydrogenase/malonic semialdehyde reductase
MSSKTILITGASSGFGAETARLFADKGWKVILAARRLDRCEAIKNEFPEASIHILELDVRDQSKVSSSLEALPEEFSKIDVLVNCAGLALGLEAADAADLDDWNQMVDTNIKGLMYCTRCLLPKMVSNGSGHVVNIGSIAGSWPYPGGNVYGATKAFVKQFSLNLRADLIGKNIRVSNIEPGMAETEFSLVRFKGDQEKSEKVYDGIKALQGRDIAEIVDWVVSRPAHVNINSVEVMPTNQAWGPLNTERES